MVARFFGIEVGPILVTFLLAGVPKGLFISAVALAIPFNSMT